MRITAFNGSPRGDKGHTGMMLAQLKMGIEQAGSQMEIIELSSYKLNLCCGCFSCWNVNLGVCAMEDDMNTLLTKIRESEIIIIAGPVYYDNISSLLKLFTERFLPLNIGKIVADANGVYKHDILNVNPDIIMVSSCDLPDMCNFEVISLYGRKLAKNLNSRLLSEIYKTQARLLEVELFGIGEKVEAFKKSLIIAGYEIATGRRVTEQTMDDIIKPFITTEEYIHTANVLAKRGSQIYY